MAEGITVYLANNARAALKTLYEANRNSKYAKDLQLATSPARIWTVVE